MAVTATFLADFSNFVQQVEKAEVRLRDFSKASLSVDKDLSRIGNSFSGQKIIQEANLAAKAVTSMGGASKLTEAEQKRLNSTLTEAIAKYKALGMEAPKNMTALHAATTGADTATKKFLPSLSSMSGMLGALGLTLGVGTIVNFGKELLRMGDELVKVADRTGLTTEEVQKLQYVAGQSGNSLDEMTAAIGKLQNNLVGGDKGAVMAIKALGLNMAELRAAAPLEQMEKIAAAIGKVPDPAARAAMAMDLFGRGGIAILPTLTSQFEDLANAAPTMSDATVRALDTAGDSLARFGTTIKVWAAESYNFTGKLFDRLIAWAFDAAGAVVKATASVLDMAKYLPGASQAFDLLGVSTEGLRKQAQWFTDAAAAQRFQIEAVDVAVRKSVPHITEYGEKTEKVSAAAKKSAAELKKFMEEVRKIEDLKMLNAEIDSAMGGYTGMADRAEDARKAQARLNDEVESAISVFKNATSSIDFIQAEIRELNALKVGPLFQEPIAELGEYFDRMKLTNKATRAELTATARHLKVQYDAMEASGQYTTDALSQQWKEWRQAAQAAGLKVKQSFREVMQDIATAAHGVSEIFATMADKTGSKAADTISEIAKFAGDMIDIWGNPDTGLVDKIVNTAVRLFKEVGDRLFKSAGEDVKNRIAKWGVEISEELGDAIADTAKRLFRGSRQGAEIFHLSDIIDADDGLDISNIEMFTERLRDVFVMLETGVFDAGQATKVLDKNFGEFAAHWTKNGGLISAQLIEMIHLADVAGLRVAAIDDFVKGQVSGAVKGISALLAPADAAIKSAQAAAGIGAALYGSFAEMVQRGASPLEALREIGPVAQKLQAQLVASGFEGGAAFNALQVMAGLAADEIAGPLLDAIHGGASALTGLYNAGILDEEMFTGLASQIASTFDSLVKQGKDGSAALRIIAPDLQRIWELQQDLGYDVDAATQGLLNQAAAAGLVGDAQRSAQDRMVTAMERTAVAVEGLATAFGVQLPASVKKLSDATVAAGDTAVAQSDRIGGAYTNCWTRIGEDGKLTFDGLGIVAGEAADGMQVDFDEWVRAHYGDLQQMLRDSQRAWDRMQEYAEEAIDGIPNVLPIDVLFNVPDLNLPQAGSVDLAFNAPEFDSFRNVGMVWPRAHRGLNLAADEVPIIAQTGERVLNRAETREYNGGGSSVTLNIATGAVVVQGAGKNADQIAGEIIPALMKRMGRYNQDGSRGKMARLSPVTP